MLLLLLLLSASFFLALNLWHAECRCCCCWHHCYPALILWHAECCCCCCRCHCILAECCCCCCILALILRHAEYCCCCCRRRCILALILWHAECCCCCCCFLALILRHAECPKAWDAGSGTTVYFDWPKCISLRNRAGPRHRPLQQTTSSSQSRLPCRQHVNQLFPIIIVTTLANCSLLPLSSC